MEITTDRFISEASTEKGTVYMQIKSLVRELDIDGDSYKYVLPSDPVKLKRSLEYGSSIAVGLDSRIYKKVLKIAGEKNILKKNRTRRLT